MYRPAFLHTNQRGATNFLFIIAVGFLVAGVVYTVWSIQQTGSSTDTSADTARGSQVPINSAGDAQGQSGDDNPSTETASLSAVGEYRGSGEATRVVGTTYQLTIVADIADPAEGKFYEGWVVGSSVVSTGRFVKQGDQYVNEFTSGDALGQHDSVVVTEETEANGLDNMPEAHVLEGSF